eukprot:c6481_g1_i1.p1 GENE.c6481_g1_i1~~c6481_g1_i1.p1  ORF type:complete len:430 (-),score=107.92 c6481_g1_i1:45-1334(-)
MFGGDEVSALVFDVGSHTTRCGYAGDDSPKAIFPSTVGYRQNDQKEDQDVVMQDSGAEKPKETTPPKSEYFVGNQSLYYRRDNTDVKNPFSQGLVNDWDVFEQLLSHGFSSLHTNATEHPLLISEPAFNTKSQRIKLCELVFEKFKPPAMFVAKTPVLTAFASGRTNAAVVDCGASFVTVSAVHEGFCLSKSLQKSALAGDFLDLIVLQQLQDLGHVIKPRYALKRKIVNDKIFITELDFPHTSVSYREFCQREIARELKEACCGVRDAAVIPPAECYELPQGSVLNFESERFRAADLLFNPSLMTEKERQIVSSITTDTSFRGLPDLVFDCVSASDVDLRRELFNNIIFAGGLSLLPGAQNRLQSDLTTTRVPHGYKLKILTATGQERRFSTWIGGSILASLGSFHQMWISKAEYEEHGPKIIEKKCP